MVRPFGIEYPGVWYHVMNRVRRGEQIFLEERDYESDPSNCVGCEYHYIFLLLSMSCQKTYLTQIYQTVPSNPDKQPPEFGISSATAG
jgi:hypothetical protein